MTTLALITALALSGCAKQKTTTAAAEPPPAPTVTTVATVDATPDYVIEVVDNFQRVEFETDSADLTAESKEVLDTNARILQENPLVKVSVIGHTDERGTELYNAQLGFDRAQAVESYLQEKGIADPRITSGSAGEYDPLVDLPTKAAWDVNRRVEFRVTWDPLDEVDTSEDNPIDGGAEKVIEVR